jgi:UDP-2-acetamido-2,6-beta-L-arabino-hexul-4-ose reductase
MTRIAITGGRGFLGWHTACRLLATRGIEPLLLGRDEFADPVLLADRLRDVDAVIHIAGVNRAATDEQVESGNIDVAQALASALGNRPTHVVFANSTQADLDNPYGRGKRRSADILRGLPGTFADVLLPNLFGEHGRPGYNSFVATFAHEVANGRQPTVSNDRELPLLHAQDAAEVLLRAAETRDDAVIRPAGEDHGIQEVLDLLNEFHGIYPVTGEIPDISSAFRLDLFNTYRAALWPAGYPIHPTVHADPRGELIETVRAGGPAGQGYLSSTRPGKVRGEHYHLRKVERFVVFRGRAEIQLRRLFHDEVITFAVTGDEPAYLDMPTMWVHNLRNVGDEDVITAFWSDQLLDPANPDQFPMTVNREA